MIFKITIAKLPTRLKYSGWVFLLNLVLNCDKLNITMIKQDFHKYAYYVFNYWQMEYFNHIGDEPEDLLNNHVLSMIIKDCYKLKIKPSNCCVIINNTFFILDKAED